MKATYNTKKNGLFRFLVFQNQDKDYEGVCLELNIVEFGENPDKLMESIQEAAFSLLEAVKKKNLPDDCLNDFAPLRYWEIAEKSEQFSNRSLKPNQAVFFNSVMKPYPSFEFHGKN